MSRIITLTKILLKNGNSQFNGDESKTKKKKSIFSKITGVGQFFLLLLIFTPFTFNLYSIAENLYNTFKPINKQGLVLSFAISSSIVIVLIFGVLYSLNVYYFSNDLETLLPLPFKSSEIVFSKFLTVLIYEYLTVLIAFSPSIVLYAIKEGITVTYVLYSIIIFLFIPIIPLSISGVICMVMMSFTPFTKNKERFRLISSIIMFGFIMCVNFYIQKFQGVYSNDVELHKGNISIITVINKYIVTNTFATKALIFNKDVIGMLNIILFISFSVLVLIIFLIIAQNLYFKGALGSTEITSKRRTLTHSEISKGTKSKTKLYSYFLKEIRLLMRSPVYFLNCVLMNFIFPLFILIPLIMQEGSVKFLREVRIELNGTETNLALPLAIGLGAAIIICSMGPVSASSISREGKSIFINKFIPIDYKTQLLSKILCGVIINFIGVIILFVIMCVMFLPKVKLAIPMLILMFLGTILCNLIGILIDIIHPKLNWSEEHKPVKQNFMLFVYVILLLSLAGTPSIIVLITDMNYYMTFIVFFLGLSILNIILWFIVKNVGVNKLKKIEM